MHPDRWSAAAIASARTFSREEASTEEWSAFLDRIEEALRSVCEDMSATRRYSVVVPRR